MSIDQIAIIIILSLALALALVGLLWTVFVYPKLTAAQQAAVRQRIVLGIASQVVPAVEQTAGDLQGVQKRQAAVAQIEEVLQDLGVKNIPPALISATIEAGVYAMNKGVEAFKAWQQQQEPMPGSIQPPNPAA